MRDTEPLSNRPARWQRKLSYLKSVLAASVDIRVTSTLYYEFLEYLGQNPTKSSHYLRYCQTLLAMLPYITKIQGKNILETGSYCAITQFLATKGARCKKSSTDLRYAIDADDASVDILLSLEVIEHLKDQTEKVFFEVVLFNGSGVRQYTREIFRVLRPGGVVILTTPNPCSACALSFLVENKAPMVFRPHEREYTRNEVVDFFSAFNLVDATTHYSFFMLSRAEQAKWTSIFERNGWDPSLRGDDHFMVFRKPQT